MQEHHSINFYKHHQISGIGIRCGIRIGAVIGISFGIGIGHIEDHSINFYKQHQISGFHLGIGVDNVHIGASVLYWFVGCIGCTTR